MSLKIFLIVLLFTALAAAVPLAEVEDFPTIKSSPKLNLQSELDKFDTGFLVKKLGDFKSDVVVRQDDESDFEATYRLPNDSIPIRYDLWLKTEVDKGIFTFDGRVKIHIKIVEPTQLITLHYRQIDIERVDMLRVNNVLISSGLTFGRDQNLDFLRVRLPQAYPRNTEFILDITYNGTLRSDSSGFYRASYTNQAGQLVWFATTQFEQTDARHAMPCYDEPGIRAITSIEIQHGSSYRAISNMPELSRTPVDGTDEVVTKFEDTPPMQTYILAFIVSDYDYASNNEVDIPQRIFAKPQSIAMGHGDYAASVVGPILRKFEDHLKVPLPLKKMDHAAITDYIWGAMENFGLITYTENNLLYDQTQPSRDREKNVIAIIAHEYAHQWFGDIVNPSWWSYLWLNEGFATLFQAYLPSLLYPDDEFMENFQTNTVEFSFYIDIQLLDSKPLNFYVESPANINSKFDSISYQKGGSFLRMIMEALTVPTFTKGLFYYLSDMYYQPATPHDLHRNLQRSLNEDFPGNGVDLDAVMSTWEDQAGYPTIHVTKSGNTFSLTQSREGGGSEIYSIPISYTTSSSLNFENKAARFWMTTQTATVASSDGWILLNIQLTGYYKVTYDVGIWNAILATVDSNYEAIHPIHRAKIITDLLTMIWNDKIEAYRGLQLINSKENQVQVWRQINELDKFYRSRLFGTEISTKYDEFIHSVVKPHTDRLGFANIGGESTADAKLRDVVKEISCRANQEECLNHEFNKLVTILEAGADTHSICNGVRLANEQVFMSLINKVLTVGNFANRYYYITQLGCSMDQTLLRNFLALALDESNNLNSWERYSIITSTKEKSLVALEISFEFVRANLADIVRVLNSNYYDLLSNFAYILNSEKHANELMEIIQALRSSGSLTEEEVAVITATYETNLEWQRKYSGDIESWLNGDAPTETTTATSQPSTSTIPSTVPSTIPSTVPSTISSTQSNEGSTSTEATTLGAGSLIASFAVVVICSTIKLLV